MILLYILEMEKLNEHLLILREELSRRCKENQLYSMRSFAKHLGVNPGTLSLILSGKRAPSIKMTEQILDNIDLSPDQKSTFFNSVIEIQKNRKLKRIDPRIREKKISIPKIKTKSLDTEIYHLINDWYHITILEMTRVKNFVSKKEWIASQLGITVTEAKLAIDRLIDLELLEIKKGKLIATSSQLRLKKMYTATNLARKNKQKQIRKKAINCIDEIPIEFRSMTSMTMPIDLSLLPEAKNLIEEFNEKMCILLESKQKQKVYALEVSLFPLQKINIKGEKNE